MGYQTKDLEIYNGIVNIKEDILSKNQISLRQAAALASNHTKDLAVVTRSCNCNKNCKSNTCVCFKFKKECMSHCHSKSKKNCCTNKS